MKSLVLTKDITPGAPVFDIASASEKDQVVTVSGQIFQAISCAGSCAIRTYELKISMTREFSNAQMTIVTKGFDEALGQATRSESEEDLTCSAVDIDQLPQYKK